MQAVVKTPHIEINIKGEIPERLLSVLEEEYGEQIQLSDEESDEETVNIFETDWYQNIKSGMNPGDNLRIYRENHGLTQARLGERLGGVTSSSTYGARPPDMPTSSPERAVFSRLRPLDRGARPSRRGAPRRPAWCRRSGSGPASSGGRVVGPP